MTWDYKVEWLITDGDREAELLLRLLELGSEGWELVTIMPRGFGTQQAFFKRRRGMASSGDQ